MRSDTNVANGEPVTLEIMIEASPETVFEFFVDPRLMRRWMGGHAVLDAQNGGRFAVDIGDNHARGSFLAVEPPERVVITWGWEGSELVPPGSSTVTFLFEAKDGGTLVRLIHSDLPAGEDIRHTHGWNHYLGRLTKAATGIDPGPDPHAERQAIMHETHAGES
ncbi:MAG TPA: SRPBCC domain-containing protein [Acidimicrobiia bacterium]|nr:SRPBCC domain-containing protein [Acidimicrobiia bacterium]